MGTSAAMQLAMLMTTPPKQKVDAMRIVTRCRSVEQFVAVFHRFCNPTSCFIPSLDTRTPGTETAFSIRLADGKPMLRGQCVVLESWTTPFASPFKRPGVRIGIRWMTPESVSIFEQLLARASANRERAAIAVAEKPPTELVPIVRQTPPPTTTQPIDTAPTQQMETPTVEMTPVVEERVAGSGFVLPANPLSELDDDALQAFVECEMSEELEDSEAVEPGPAQVPEMVAEVVDATVPTRAPVSTLLGVAPLPIPKTDDWLLIMPRDAATSRTIPRDDATPLPAPVEETLPLVTAPRPPATRRMATPVRTSGDRTEIIVRTRRPGMQRSFVRAISTMSSEERWWMVVAGAVALITLAAILMSSFASLG